MKDSPFRSYLKHILFRKRDLDFSFVTISFSSYIIFYICYKSLKSEIYIIIAAILIVMFICYIPIRMFIMFYQHWKMFNYGKTKLPDKIERADPQYEIKSHLFELESRVKELEKVSPLNLALYAIFIGIAIAIALYLISTIFPH